MLRYKLDSADARHAQALESLDAKAQEVLRALANQDQKIDDRFTAQGSLIRNLHLETTSTIQEEGSRINYQIIATQARIEHFADRSENQTHRILDSQYNLAEDINDARQADTAALQMEMERHQHETRQQLERMQAEIVQQIKSVESQISKENTELKTLILSMEENIKKQDSRRQQRCVELGNAKTLAIRAKQIFLEHLKVNQVPQSFMALG